MDTIKDNNRKFFKGCLQRAEQRVLVLDIALGFLQQELARCRGKAEKKALRKARDNAQIAKDEAAQDVKLYEWHLEQLNSAACQEGDK